MDQCIKYHGYMFKKKIGEGISGKVYITCQQKNCHYIAKVINLGKTTRKTDTSQITQNVFKEIDIQKKAAQAGIAPKIKEHFPCGNLYIIVMELIEGISFKDYKKEYSNKPLQIERIKKKIVEKIRQLNRLHISHNDLHDGNIMIKTKHNNEIIIIDYGLAEIDDTANEIDRFEIGGFNSSQIEFYD